MAKAGDLCLVREADRIRTRDGRRNKLHHEKCTGPGTVKRVQPTGLSVDVEMKNRITRKRSVATFTLKPCSDGLRANAHHHRRG